MQFLCRPYSSQTQGRIGREISIACHSLELGPPFHLAVCSVAMGVDIPGFDFVEEDDVVRTTPLRRESRGLFLAERRKDLRSPASPCERSRKSKNATANCSNCRHAYLASRSAADFSDGRA